MPESHSRQSPVAGDWPSPSTSTVSVVSLKQAMQELPFLVSSAHSTLHALLSSSTHSSDHEVVQHSGRCAQTLLTHSEVPPVYSWPVTLKSSMFQPETVAMLEPVYE